jgi:hypothetical protein
MTYVAEVDSERSRNSAPIMAGLLILTTLVETVAIFHHPHVQGHDRLQATLQIVALSHLGGWIHALAIGCSLLNAYCLAELLRIRVPGPVLRAAAVAYGAGIVCWITAATIDGWVLEQLAGNLPRDTPADLENNMRLFELCMDWVVASTNVGVVLTSVGILIASAGMFRNVWSWRIAGVLGVVVGTALSLGIGAGRLSMDRHGIIVAVGSQGIWFICLSIVSLTASFKQTAARPQ